MPRLTNLFKRATYAEPGFSEALADADETVGVGMKIVGEVRWVTRSQPDWPVGFVEVVG